MTNRSKIPSPIELRLIAILSNEVMLDGRKFAKKYEEMTEDEMPYGTLYTTLRRMSEQKWIASDTNKSDKRESIYHLLKDGKDALNKGRKFYRDLADFCL